MNGPNPIGVGWSVLRAMRVKRPQPIGPDTADHELLAVVLGALRQGGVSELPEQRTAVAEYRSVLQQVDPDDLSRSDALAFWLNLYNAGALDVAAAAFTSGEASVFRIPGAFSRPWVTIAGERLSLDDIEHGKIRRFGDPRIHGALVCGSVSCPTLRHEPFAGQMLDVQLEDQMRSFLAGGGAIYDAQKQRLQLSRVFLWYGADYVRPHRMPTWIPATRRSIAAAVTPWLDEGVRDRAASAKVEFQSYDWGLACAIG